MPRQQIVQMPHDLHLQTQGSAGRYQTGTDTVRMDQIRIQFNYLSPEVANHFNERSAVPEERTRPPGKAGFEVRDGADRHACFGRQAGQRTVCRADHDSLKLDAVELHRRVQQQPLSATDFSGMVVKDDLHST
jgi:hypothetical protein